MYRFLKLPFIILHAY